LKILQEVVRAHNQDMTVGVSLSATEQPLNPLLLRETLSGTATLIDACIFIPTSGAVTSGRDHWKATALQESRMAA
jgi:hypothetical protein